MTIEEIQGVLNRAAAFRTPRFADDPIHVKISKLEDAMLDSAYQRGELEDAWRYCARAVRQLEEELMEIEVPKGRLADDRQRALREEDPDTWGALRTAVQLRQEIERQIKRLVEDASNISRVYTFITGN